MAKKSRMNLTPFVRRVCNGAIRRPYTTSACAREAFEHTELARAFIEQKNATPADCASCALKVLYHRNGKCDSRLK